jgi:hypothetical protein
MARLPLIQQSAPLAAMAELLAAGVALAYDALVTLPAMLIIAAALVLLRPLTPAARGLSA